MELLISILKIDAFGTVMEIGRISCELVDLVFPSSVSKVVIQVPVRQVEQVTQAELVSLIKLAKKIFQAQRIP